MLMLVPRWGLEKYGIKLETLNFKPLTQNSTQNPQLSTQNS